jgi:hypothetical protein
VDLFNLDEICETRTQFWTNLTQKQEWMERKGTPHFLVQESDKSLKNEDHHKKGFLIRSKLGSIQNQKEAKLHNTQSVFF